MISIPPAAILVCPQCHNSISKKNKFFYCAFCRKKYPVNKNILLFDVKKGDDVQLSEKKWEKLHSDHDLHVKDYKDDSAVKSYLNFLSKYKRDFKKGLLLDLGCGVAYASSVLAKDGVKIVGVDISLQALLKSRLLLSKLKTRSYLLQSDLLRLPIANKTVDLIYSCMSLEYVKDTQKAFHEAYRVLKPGKKMIAILPVVSLTTLTYHQLRGDIPNIPIIRGIMEFVHLKIFKSKYMQYGYSKTFTVSSLRKMAVAAGFTVKNIDYFDMYYPIEFVPNFIRPKVQRILRSRLFWPLVFIEAAK